MVVPEAVIGVARAAIVEPRHGYRIGLMRTVVPVDPYRLDRVAAEAAIDDRGKAGIRDDFGRLSQGEQRGAVAIDKDDALAVDPHQYAGHRSPGDVVEPFLEFEQHL